MSGALTPCPFTYANGKRCSGHIVSIERYHVKAEWTYDEALDSWNLGVWDGGTHLHLFCSAVSEHSPPVKCWPNELPDGLLPIVLPGEEG